MNIFCKWLLATALSLFLFSVTLTNAQADLSTGLIGHYLLDGNAQDSSGNSNDGTVSGGAASTEDRFGNLTGAYFFDGVDDSVQVNSNAALDSITNASTISAWVRPDSTSESYIVGRVRNNSLFDDPLFLGTKNTKLRSINCSNSPNACNELFDTQTFTVGQWYHIVNVFDGSSNSARLYVDGIEKAVTTTSYSSLATSLLGLGIGGAFGAPQQQFEGAIDDVRIYNRALSTLEVDELFELERPRLTDGLLSHYPFEESTDAALIDEVGGYDGIQVLSGIVVDQPGIVGKAHHLPGNAEGDNGAGIWVVDQPGFNIGLSSMTVNGWFKAEPTQRLDPLIWGWRGNAGPTGPAGRINPNGSNDRFYLKNSNSSAIDLVLASDGAGNVARIGTSISLANQWKMVTVVLDRTSQLLLLYVDGALIASDDASAVGAINADGPLAPFVLGTVNTECCHTPIRTWGGDMDEVSIWTRALSAEDIVELHDLGSNGVSLIDQTAPTITPTVSGTLGNNGWYTSDVTVDWTVTDGESAISSTNGCDTTTITADTVGVTLTCEATSDGGTASESVTLKRDATAPSISGNATPPANSNGWNNTDVTVSFSGSDGTSGIASCPADVLLSSEGIGQTVSGNCTDLAGNTSAPATVSDINIDKTAPTPIQSGPFAVNEGDSVVLDGTGSTDSLSGIASTAWALDNDNLFDDSDPATFNSIDDSINPVALKVVDLADNEAIANTQVTVNNVAPTINSVTVPLVPVDINNQSAFTVDATFSDPGGVNDEPYRCDFDMDNDGTNDASVSGVTGTSCSNPLNYAQPGLYTVKVTVTDKDGDSDSVTTTNTIVICNVTGEINDNVTVDPGDVVVICQASVFGNVEVTEGTVFVLDSTIEGNVLNDFAGQMTIANSVVEGNIEGKKCEGVANTEVTVTASTVDGSIVTEKCSTVMIADTDLNGSIESKEDGDVTITGNDADGDIKIEDLSGSCVEANNTASSNTGCP